MSERKLPRVDLRKFLSGGVAGRREAVTLVGDALREHGAVRVEGSPGGEAAALAAVGGHLLAALADYFGLAESAFGGAVARAGDMVATDAHVLLLILAGVPAGTELRRDGQEWRAISAHPGELLAVPGSGIAALTAGVLSAAEVRPPPGGAAAVALTLPPGAAAAPLPEFRVKDS